MKTLKSLLTSVSAFAGMCLLVFAVSANAATLTVTNTNDSGAGSLRQALVDPECIYFANDIVFAIPTTDLNYDPVAERFTITLTDTLAPCLGSGATTTITNAMAQAVTIRGTDSFRIFDLSSSDADVTLTNLTISDGYAMDGGAIYTSASRTLTLNDCIIENNGAASNGGAIFLNSGSTLNVNRSTIRGNSSDTAGAIYVTNGSFLTLNSSTLSGNSATGFAGGSVYSDGTVNAVNNTFSGNTSSFIGGAIYSFGSMTLTNNTVVNNQAQVGGGLFNDASATLNNNLIALNVATDFAFDIYGGASGTYNLIGNIDDSSGINTATNIWGTGGAPLNPVIGPLQNNGGPTFTHALLTGSPAIDQGNSPVVTTDQRGYTRPSDIPGVPNAADGSDMGAFEMVGPSSASVSISGQVLTSAGKGGYAISGVTIYLADMDGNIQTARTNPMGYYQFHDVPAGETYVVSAQHKRYRFDTKTVNANDEIADLNFAPLF